MTKAVRLTSLTAGCTATILCRILIASDLPGALHPATANYLEFSGDGAYAEIPTAPDLRFNPEGLTVSAWLRPDTLPFRKSEGSGYVYWMGKGEPSRHEWAMRMYSYTNTEKPPRPNRISFFLFNPDGGLGEGSYTQEPVRPGEWIQITAWAYRGNTAIYRNGGYVRCDEYDGPGRGCQAHPEHIHPTPGSALLRLGTRDLKSFFQGGLSQVRI
jgi:Concanavalin A-like lectin/glucanases superfamily